MGIIGYARTCVGVERLQVLQVCKFRVHFHPGHLCQMEDGSQGISACSFGQGMSVQFVCFIVVVLSDMRQMRWNRVRPSSPQLLAMAKASGIYS